jgi:transposase
MRLTRSKKQRAKLVALACANPEVLLWWQDECWFSRFAQPNAHAWGGLHLMERESAYPEAQKALACYGAVRHDTGQLHLAFCSGQPNSDATLCFLPQLLAIGRAEGKRWVIVIWDHATWHKSQKVRHWVRRYNQQAKQTGDVRLLVWRLPKNSPWLNPIEPRWLHGKRAVLEPRAEPLTVQVLRERLCVYYRSQPNDLISNEVC